MNSVIHRYRDLHPVVSRGLASVALVSCAALVAGLGTFGLFTSTTSATNSTGAGTVKLDIGSAGTTDNRLDVNATDIAPGDTIERSFTLTNSGSIDLSALQLDTVASISSPLDANAGNGLQMAIDGCSQPWTEGGIAPAYTYTCEGALTHPLTSSPVIQTAVPMPGLSVLTAGGVDYLRLKLTLPTTADNTFQGESSTITYTFSGTQRSGTSK